MGRALSLKQLHDGAFLLGGGWPAEATPDRRGYRLNSESLKGNWAAACAGRLAALSDDLDALLASTPHEDVGPRALAPLLLDRPVGGSSGR